MLCLLVSQGFHRASSCPSQLFLLPLHWQVSPPQASLKCLFSYHLPQTGKANLVNSWDIICLFLLSTDISCNVKLIICGYLFIIGPISRPWAPWRQGLCSHSCCAIVSSTQMLNKHGLKNTKNSQFKRIETVRLCMSWLQPRPYF